MISTSDPLSNSEYILSAEAMREADQYTIDSFGIPAFTLMESAGRAVVDSLKTLIHNPSSINIICLCGKGNNGGDGFVIARYLANLGTHVHIISISPEQIVSDYAAKHYQLLKDLANQDQSIKISLLEYGPNVQLESLPKADIIVDALLGIGLRNSLRAPYDSLVTWINRQSSYTVAVDIPSGLDANTGKVLGNAVCANKTITLGATKTGLLIGQGPELVGSIEVVDIGIPKYVVEQYSNMEGCAQVASHEVIKKLLPKRSLSAHKYSVGMALVIAGSAGMTGAATLASKAAEQAGTGAVVCASPENIQPILAQKLTEVMTLGLPADVDGIDLDQALESLAPRLAKADALLIGCGMGQLASTQSFIRTVASETEKPLVLDADGLNAFKNHTHLLKDLSKGQWILTPHLGEFRRLTNPNVDVDNKIQTVSHFAREWNCVLILKGAPSIVGTPEGTVYINPTGNNALATAGTGDVLAGLCVGFLSQGLSPIEAALCALHVGGSAADNYSQNQHPSTMLASDLIDHTRIVLSDRYYKYAP